MAIIENLTESQFIQRFKDYNRMDNFTYESLGALYNYLNDLSDAIDETIELDVIALCCEWCKSDYETIIQEYNIDCDDIDQDDLYDHVVEYLEDNTTVIELRNKDLLYYNF